MAYRGNVGSFVLCYLKIAQYATEESGVIFITYGARWFTGNVSLEKFKVVCHTLKCLTYSIKKTFEANKKYLFFYSAMWMSSYQD